MLNGFVFTLVTGGIKMKDTNVYTPKFLLGKSRQDIINNTLPINNIVSTVSTTTNIIEEIKDVGNNVINVVNTATKTSLKRGHKDKV